MTRPRREELWLLTLQRQARHVAAHLEFDLPQAQQLARMDPLLYKKLDWEVTHGHDVLHHEAFQAADCEQGEYIKEQMGLEALSHHMLPLIRYRRVKARAARGARRAARSRPKLRRRRRRRQGPARARDEGSRAAEL